jgi:heptosyltransferase-1
MKFLIVKTSSLGDVIHTFPVAQYLKKRDPTCQIDWIVEEEYVALAQSHPDVSQVHPIATRRWRRSLFKKKSFCELAQMASTLRKNYYNVIFDLQGNTKSAFLTQMAHGAKKVGFSWASSPEWPHCLVTKERFNVDPHLPIQRRYLSIVQQFYKDPEPFEPQGVALRLNALEEEKLLSYKCMQQPRIMVAFASKWENKCLSLPTLIQFLKSVHEQEKCYFYFVSGDGLEKKVADHLAQLFPGSLAVEPLSLPLWQRLMGEMDLVIAADSAALALCGTTSAPSFSFFGPTKASVYKPLGHQHRHFQGTCPYKVPFAARCPNLRSCKTGACLKDVPAADILKKLLHRKKSIPKVQVTEH